MFALDHLLQARQRGHVALADLDRFVTDPASYEKERAAFVRRVVRERLPLFPGESAAASVANPKLAGGGVAPTDLYQVYLSELHRIPRMERNEEFRFVIALEIARDALAVELTVPRPTRRDIQYFEKRIPSHDATFRRLLDAARQRTAHRASNDVNSAQRAERVYQRFEEMLAWKRVLVFRTLPLVPGMARKYKGMGVPVMDLIQDANSSLMKATDRYDWRKNVRFVVYARWWVQQGILKSLSCHSRTVRTPVYLAQKLKKIRDLNDRSVSETGERLTTEALGAALDEPVERVERALAAAKMTVSIDRDLDPTGDFTLREILTDPHEFVVNDAPSGPALSNRIDDALAELTSRERMVLEFRFGLHEHKTETLEAVSARLGVSRERVRQIQEQAIRKLQSPSKKLKLAEFLND
ncbi:MAG: RNA polymerase sigma factor RpoD/SigA [Planctomycetota bacterium]